MEYPEGFPEHLKAPVDAVIPTAEIEFLLARRDLDVAADRAFLDGLKPYLYSEHYVSQSEPTIICHRGRS